MYFAWQTIEKPLYKDNENVTGNRRTEMAAIFQTLRQARIDFVFTDNTERSWNGVKYTGSCFRFASN